MASPSTCATWAAAGSRGENAEYPQYCCKNCKFYVILLVSRPSGEEVTAEAIKSIIQAVNYTLPPPLIKSNMLLSGTPCLFISVQETIFLHFSLFCLYPCLDYFPLSAHRTKNIFTKHSQTSQTRNLLLLQNWTFTSFVRLRKREWNHKDYNLKFYFKTIMWSGFQICKYQVPSW